MKTKALMYFKNYREGEGKQGKKWKMLVAMDESFNSFNLFGEKAENFKNKKVGEKIEVDIEITPVFNVETKKYDNVIRLV